MDLMLSPAESQALLLSLEVSAAAVLGALPFAFTAALALARANFPGKTLLEGALHLPLILPPVAVGFLLLMTLGTRHGLGAFLLHRFGIRFVFSWTGAALASGLITFPLQLRAIRQALDHVDRNLLSAAATLGAGVFDRLVNVAIPLAWPGILSGAITAFAASLGEFGAIITFVSNIPGQTRTLPLAIYSALQSPGGDLEAARLSAISILLALVFLALANLLRGSPQR
ncbi:MAG: molybdate ABC transporter permease subunit [Alphaproteobacteria bacterium]|nr:molybdate ABC transporter permease subunit [Alphaproteobacteria bacterium]